jgi:hypothetical protein
MFLTPLNENLLIIHPAFRRVGNSEKRLFPVGSGTTGLPTPWDKQEAFVFHLPK